MIIKILIKFFTSKFFLTLIGALWVISYIWLYFVRERLPRDIPFEPSLWSIITLISINILYLYILLRILRPKPINPIFLQIMEKLRFLYKPLYLLDEEMRNGVYTKTFIDKIVKKLATVLSFVTDMDKNRYLYILWYIIPRIILAILLIIDVFYFYKLNYVYKFAFLTLIIFLCYYIIYCMRLKIGEYTAELDKYYQVEITSKDYVGSNYYADIEDITWDYDREADIYGDTEHWLNISNFVHYQKCALWFDYTPYEYKCVFKTNILYKQPYLLYKKYPLIIWPIDFEDDDRKNIEKDFYDLLPKLVSLTSFIESYDDMFDKFNWRQELTSLYKFGTLGLIVKLITILLPCMYIISWSYILYLTLCITDFSEIITIFVPPSNPFF